MFVASCISSYSYIKPQLSPTTVWNVSVVYHPIPTSNHNVGGNHHELSLVVYHPIPTSNHNAAMHGCIFILLYIILFLHQTTTLPWSLLFQRPLYIILFLHQTTTQFSSPQKLIELYIILFLHQTTTSFL